MAASPDVPAVGGQAAAVVTPRRTPRAGRDLVAAIAVGAGLGAVILLSLLLVRQWFVLVLAAAAAVGTWELAGALRRGAEIAVPLPVLLVGGQAMIWLAWPFGLRGIAAAFAAGDFRTPAFVHMRQVPGTAVMAAERSAITYAVRDLPRGGEVRITTRDAEALAAVHAFIAYQRQDHRAGGAGTADTLQRARPGHEHPPR